jgi:hypothetical protein
VFFFCRNSQEPSFELCRCRSAVVSTSQMLKNNRISAMWVGNRSGRVEQGCATAMQAPRTVFTCNGFLGNGSKQRTGTKGNQSRSFESNRCLARHCTCNASRCASPASQSMAKENVSPQQKAVWSAHTR